MKPYDAVRFSAFALVLQAVIKFAAYPFNHLQDENCCFSSRRLNLLCDPKFSTVQLTLNERVMSFGYRYN